MQVDRLPSGGLIDRSRPLAFTFDGRRFEGFAGDTIASALLANGVRLMGRSFKYHRPRGPLSAGPEEPNALVTVGEGARADPNARATVQELHEGLVAKPQNFLGSLRFDLLAMNDLLHPFLGAGFYYKTFMWPAAFWERVYEPAIRRAAGLGALAGLADPDEYEIAHAHCDLLVIGAGPSGLMAALTAGRAGRRVILADEDFLPGGRLNAETFAVGGDAASAWAAAAAGELRSLPNVRLMTRTTVFGVYDGGEYGLVERNTDHLAAPPDGLPRMTLWKVHAPRAVLAAGAVERPIAFGANDRPGIMMAGAARTWLNRFAVLPGRRAVVFTASDDGWRTARDLAAAGAEVTVVDPREEGPEAAGLRAIRGGALLQARGRSRVSAVTVRDASGREERIVCDLVAISGGWSPSVHLSTHLGRRPLWREEIAAFVPGERLPPGMEVAGAARGVFSAAACLRDGAEAAARALGVAPAEAPEAEDGASGVAPFWHVKGAKRAFLDFQNDVSVHDLEQSVREGFGAPEHAKRYTTLGMATDQGKTANVPALGVLAEFSGTTIPALGTTTFRPPWTPVPIAAFAGRRRGKAFHATRLPPSHDRAAAMGADFVEAGFWLRAQWHRREGERGWRDSVDREAETVRRAVGVCDVSTLGKIDVKGPDSGAFLDFLYRNTISTLPLGRCRYGLMLREDGIVFDDGTVARLGPEHFLVTTTTAKAVEVLRHMEFARQCLKPARAVSLVSVTDQWAQYSVAGPRSRDLLARIVDPAHDISDAAFPYLACGEVSICGGVQARLFRISFSGERAFEIAAPARYGHDLFAALLEAGAEWGAAPYGVEALSVLRVEKGHPAGAELDGRTTAADLGLAGLGAKKRAPFIGREMEKREGLQAPGRPRLVGLRPVDPAARITAGAHLVEPGAEPTTANDLGWVSSVAWSPDLRAYIGLGFLANGEERRGERVRVWDGLRRIDVEAEVTSPHHVDPEGERLRG